MGGQTRGDVLDAGWLPGVVLGGSMVLSYSSL